MFEMKLSDPGEGLTEAEIVTWLVAAGDTVKVNDIVVEIETSKSLVELPSPFDGVVAELRAAEGEIVPVGSVIMTLTPVDADAGDTAPEPGGETSPSAQTEADPTVGAEVAASGDAPAKEPDAAASGSVLVGYGTTAAPLTRRPRKGAPLPQVPETGQVNEAYSLDETPAHKVDEIYPTQPVRDEAQEPPLPGPDAGRRPDTGLSPEPGRRPLAKPAVRRLARDLGIDLQTIVGSGPGETITPVDVARAAAGSSGGRKPPTRIPLRGVRREMAAAMAASVSVPQSSVWLDVDVTNTVTLIEQLRARREFAGLRISPILILAKAVCLALERHPEVNSTLDWEGQQIVVHSDVNLGVAAATRRGLVVPNMKRANELSLLELAQALNDLVAKVREGRISPADAAGGTFTITNVGVFGVEGGTPILNRGESAILLLGTFNRRPWVVGTGDTERIEIRSVCTLTLTIDHRVLDGEQASTFLADVAEILTDPALSLLF